MAFTMFHCLLKPRDLPSGGCWRLNAQSPHAPRFSVYQDNFVTAIYRIVTVSGDPTKVSQSEAVDMLTRLTVTSAS